MDQDSPCSTSSPPTPWEDSDPEEFRYSPPPEELVTVDGTIDTPTDFDLDLALVEDVDQDVDNVSEVFDDGHSDARDTKEMVSLVKAQEPFQPGSTPMENTKRYLDNVEPSSPVNLAPRMLRMFCTGRTALGPLAPSGSTKFPEALPLSVSLRRFAAHWISVEGADIENLGNVVIATSDGTFVTMVAGSEWLFLVTRDGGTTTDGSQNLMGRLIKFDDFCILQKENIPVTKHHTLKWVGITEEGAPAIYDSSGALSVMPRFRVPLSAMWVRILRTGQIEQGRDNDRSYWPVGIIGAMFFCVVLRGQQTHPGFPRPLLNEVSVSLPFNGIDSQEARLERLVNQEILLLHILRDGMGEMGDQKSSQDLAERELALDKTLIQLIKHACQTSNPGRALDFARLLHALPSLDTAIKIAMSFSLTNLQTAIERLKALHRGLVCQGSSASQRSMKLAMTKGTPSVENSSQKRPADDDRLSSGSSDAKRCANNTSYPLQTHTERQQAQPLLLYAQIDWRPLESG
uniref:Zn(2)-C6 fungal-type domain-containing protein n=1 Tax=Ganoderma boninense TaxID=34458 RepID=A0A5K1K1I2_9APHY|nr:Zn(2)-C6 fungal-type domain-containing protein [Ganoderma boninense]